MGIRMYSKYERRTDTRTYEDRRKLYELNISKLCGRRSILNGQRGQRPNCQNGSENAQARRPESQSLLKMMTKEVPKPQQKLKKKKRKKKKRKKKRKKKKKRNKSFIIHTASSSYKIRRKKL